MFANLTSGLDLHTKALVIRAERQRILASNIANADTPGYVGRELNFKEAMAGLTHFAGSELPGPALQMSGTSEPQTTNPGYMVIPGCTDSELNSPTALVYGLQSQPNADGNTVDLDRERASFVDNSVHYEATLRFINGQSKTILTAIQGQ